MRSFTLVRVATVCSAAAAVAAAARTCRDIEVGRSWTTRSGVSCTLSPATLEGPHPERVWPVIHGLARIWRHTLEPAERRLGIHRPDQII